MSNPKTAISEWDKEEQAEETSDPTYPRFLAHWAVQFLPLLALAVAMVAVGIRFHHHP